MTRLIVHLTLWTLIGTPATVLFFRHAYYPLLALFMPDDVATAVAHGVGLAVWCAVILYLIIASDRGKCAPLDADYDAKLAPLYVEHDAKLAPLYADLVAKRAAFDADYMAKRVAFDADYMAKRDALFGQLAEGP